MTSSSSSLKQGRGLAWRKASRSTPNNACVEVAAAGDDVIAVRDSKNPDGPMLLYPSAGFGMFLNCAKNGEFDNPG